jgi:hypothetical protein
LIIPGLASPACRRSVLKMPYPVHLDNILDRANSPIFQTRPVPALASCTGTGEICTGAGELYWRRRVVPALARYVLALARSVPAIWPRGKQPQGYVTRPGKAPIYVANRGRRGALNVHLQGVVKRTVPPGANKDSFLASPILYPERSSDL